MFLGRYFDSLHHKIRSLPVGMFIKCAADLFKNESKVLDKWYLIPPKDSTQFISSTYSTTVLHPSLMSYFNWAIKTTKVKSLSPLSSVPIWQMARATGRRWEQLMNSIWIKQWICKIGPSLMPYVSQIQTIKRHQRTHYTAQGQMVFDEISLNAIVKLSPHTRERTCQHHKAPTVENKQPADRNNFLIAWKHHRLVTHSNYSVNEKWPFMIQFLWKLQKAVMERSGGIYRTVIV